MPGTAGATGGAWGAGQAKDRQAAEEPQEAGQIKGRHTSEEPCRAKTALDRACGTNRVIDVLMRETDPEYVSFELDAGWCAAAESDPIAFVEQYSGRVKLIKGRPGTLPDTDLSRGFETCVQNGTELPS